MKFPNIRINISDNIPPPSPIPLIPSPKHTQCKNPQPTRATHCYTTGGLILSEPNLESNSMEKSRSLDSSVELSFETFGKDKKRSLTAAPLVEQMALYKQQSLTKTLDLQPKSTYNYDENDELPKLPPRSNETFDTSNSLPSKSHPTNLNNKQTISLPNNFPKPNKSNQSNLGYETFSTSQAKNSVFCPQNQLPNPQPYFSEFKPTGYRENSIPFQSYTGQNQRFPHPQANFPDDFNLQNFAPKFPHQNTPYLSQCPRTTTTNVLKTTKYPQQQQQQQQKFFHQPTTNETPPQPPPRPLNLGKYPTHFERQQPTITNFPTSHWV